jgi:hypothetical protein
MQLSLVVLGRKHLQGTNRVREGVLRCEPDNEARKVVFRLLLATGLRVSSEDALYWICLSYVAARSIHQ